MDDEGRQPIAIGHLSDSGDLINLNPLHPRMICALFCWNWPSGSGAENYKNFFNVFPLFHLYLPSEMAMALYFNKLNPLHPRMIVLNIAEIGPVVLVEMRPVVLAMKTKMWKVKENNNDDVQISIRKAHLSHWRRWAKKNWQDFDFKRKTNGQGSSLSLSLFLHHHPISIIIYIIGVFQHFPLSRVHRIGNFHVNNVHNDKNWSTFP